MDLHRFREQMNGHTPTSGHTPPPAPGAFVAIPLSQQPVGGLVSLYQLAFLQAQAAKARAPRARDLFAVLN
jgi:hypothetical protein